MGRHRWYAGMPSAPFWSVSLAKRVRRLERSIQPEKETAWRAYLAQYFAGNEYDEHREHIIDALCSDDPRYSFTTEADNRYYLINWPYRSNPRLDMTPLVIIMPAEFAWAI